ncbi:MAG: hypothetical protein A4E53_00146 [Pelotomaculum sp. PtaB.Bin104]|nr:MAG: hypothetical protein A4E53_00146 [Pelotomaculum sp. PtaB.Bin104]
MPELPDELPPFELLRIDLGINVRDEHSQIGDGQSPYSSSTGRPGALNVVSDGKGGIKKRNGYTKVYETSLGTGAIHGIWDYLKRSGIVTRIIHHGTKLYTQSGSDQPVEILGGVADTKGVAFTYNDIFYYIDGTQYWQYNGTSAEAVTPYTPTITTDRNPDGTGGASNEELNQISDRWKDSFSGDGVTTTYLLSFTELSATEVIVTIDGATKTENTHFTVNRTNGTVDFTGGTSPHGAPVSGTNNVVIQAEKIGLNDHSFIKKCKYVSLFGGKNDTRVFLTGNLDYPATVYWCDIDNPLYFPVNNYNDIGSSADFNVGLMFQYDMLIVLKHNSIWRIEYEFDSSTNTGTFASYPLNSGIGCDMPHSIQLVDNYIVFCSSTKGPQIIESTDIRTEKNVRSLGELINKGPGRLGLLDESNADLLAATSFDDGTHYVLCVGSKCWAWDYKKSPWLGSADSLVWWYWDNINANCWVQYQGVIVFGDRDNGLLYKFQENKNDDGVAINGVWRSKLLHFDWQEWLKTISLVFFRTNLVNEGNIMITVYNDQGTKEFTETITSNSFNWTTFDWSNFTWAVNVFDPVLRLKIKLKKIKYFQIEFSNNTLNQDLSILDLKVYYSLNRKVKS